jgi:N-acetylglucosaminyldiphosphoundecaprenol N-acetyl-beta-D-mannosaminyltransferase
MRKKIQIYYNESALKHGKILDVYLTSTSLEKVLRFFDSRLTRFSTENKSIPKVFVVTPNPELVNMCQSDGALLKIVNSATLAPIDGVGLTFAWRFLGLAGRPQRIKGRVLFYELIKLANQKGWRVFFLGDKTVKTTKTVLSRNFKRVLIEAEEGPWLDTDANPLNSQERKKESEVVTRINAFGPHILFVGFGVPKQEKWVYKWLPKLNVGSAMVLGGTFDYFAGKAVLPPNWMEKLGLEWLWRLTRQPWRVPRILSAVVAFPLRVLASKITRK